MVAALHSWLLCVVTMRKERRGGPKIDSFFVSLTACLCKKLVVDLIFSMWKVRRAVASNNIRADFCCRM